MNEPHLALTDPVISIGMLAKRVGLSVSAIRKYESEGLIISHRSTSGRRLFSHEDIDRVRLIHHLIHTIGLNIEGIRRLQAMLPCWELRGDCGEKKEQCIALKDSSRPCWMIKGNLCVPQAEKCRQCVVYRFGTQCIEDIKPIVFGTDVSNVEDDGT